MVSQKGPDQIRRAKGPRYTPVSKRQDKPENQQEHDGRDTDCDRADGQGLAASPGGGVRVRDRREGDHVVERGEALREPRVEPLLYLLAEEEERAGGVVAHLDEVVEGEVGDDRWSVAGLVVEMGGGVVLLVVCL